MYFMHSTVFNILRGISANLIFIYADIVAINVRKILEKFLLYESNLENLSYTQSRRILIELLIHGYRLVNVGISNLAPWSTYRPFRRHILNLECHFRGNAKIHEIKLHTIPFCFFVFFCFYQFSPKHCYKDRKKYWKGKRIKRLQNKISRKGILNRKQGIKIFKYTLKYQRNSYFFQSSCQYYMAVPTELLCNSSNPIWK